jgi:hypothetical protein
MPPLEPLRVRILEWDMILVEILASSTVPSFEANKERSFLSC